ncbi:MAG: hypothetical protein BGO25_02840 [Acidobacteriales bacterium 59-55]|nr:MAG: hypothetical protein BGO25_02840 [Acidobacteriales bacterium 59-55]
MDGDPMLKTSMTTKDGLFSDDGEAKCFCYRGEYEFKTDWIPSIRRSPTNIRFRLQFSQSTLHALVLTIIFPKNIDTQFGRFSTVLSE